MEFDKSRVYIALNADELKVGSKVIVANSIGNLKELVEQNMAELSDLTRINNVYSAKRFIVNEDTDRAEDFAFVYLISEPEEKNWIVYINRPECIKPYLTACREDKWESVKEYDGAKTKLFEGTEEECEKWYTSRDHLTDVIAAWEDGKIIQYNSRNGWKDCCDNRPVWDTASEFRIKPELKWTDLKIGDVIQNKCYAHCYMVIGIDMREESRTHIYNGVTWLDNDDLENWEKVE